MYSYLAKKRLSRGLSLEDMVLITNLDKNTCKLIEQRPFHVSKSKLITYLQAIELNASEYSEFTSLIIAKQNQMKDKLKQNNVIKFCKKFNTDQDQISDIEVKDESIS